MRYYIWDIRLVLYLVDLENYHFLYLKKITWFLNLTETSKHLHSQSKRQTLRNQTGDRGSQLVEAFSWRRGWRRESEILSAYLLNRRVFMFRNLFSWSWQWCFLVDLFLQSHGVQWGETYGSGENGGWCVFLVAFAVFFTFFTF